MFTAYQRKNRESTALVQAHRSMCFFLHRNTVIKACPQGICQCDSQKKHGYLMIQYYVLHKGFNHHTKHYYLTRQICGQIVAV